MSKEMPEELRSVAVMFADGARGMRLQVHENREFGVTCSALKKDRDSSFVQTFTSELTDDEEYPTFAALRDAYNKVVKK